MAVSFPKEYRAIIPDSLEKGKAEKTESVFDKRNRALPDVPAAPCELRLYRLQILATPVLLAASATALATAGPTRLSKAAGMM